MFNFLPTMPGVQNVSLDNQRAIIATNFQNLVEATGYEETNTGT